MDLMNRDRVRTRPLSGGQRGFGLLELLIALTILAIGTLGIMKLQMQSSFGNAGSRNQSAAANLARSKLEELKRVGAYSIQQGATIDLVDPESANPATTIDLGDWSNPDFTEGPFNESQDASNPQGRIFTRSWNVVDNYPIVNFKTIRIRVSWNQGGQPRYVDLETQIGLKNLEYFD
jgi:prepilin-type N-terminal cleavage/methylation domain-containing protein